MQIEIKHRTSGVVLFAAGDASLCVVVEAAVKADANLGGANLRGAYLRGANLRGANLGGANLRGADLGDADLGGADLRGADLGDAYLGDANLGDANLGGANLRGANLGDANLGGADLRGANLRDANLRGANLGGANLRGAYLRGAYLRGANLRGANLGDADLGGADLRGADLGDANLRDANLRGANLGPVRDDLWAVLSASPREAHALRLALLDGRVDGSCYEGACACLVGTLANAAGKPYCELPFLKPDADRPAERFFLTIHPGDTPDASPTARLALEWVDQWISNMEAAFGPSRPLETAPAAVTADGQKGDTDTHVDI